MILVLEKSFSFSKKFFMNQVIIINFLFTQDEVDLNKIYTY